MKEKLIRLTIVYPEFEPDDMLQTAGKSIIGESLSAINPFLEILAIPIIYFYEQAKEHLYNKKLDAIEFKNEKIIIYEGSEIKKYNLIEINDLKINFSFIFNFKTNKVSKFSTDVSKVSFNFNGQNHEYYYRSEKKKIFRLCKMLYECGINFKEYRSGKRVFLGNQLTYQKVQEFKSKYNIDW